MFTSLIHDAARSIKPSGRGELEITDAIQWLVDGGRRVEPHIVRGWWKDTGRLDDMLEANRLILETIDRQVDGELTESQIDGRVIVEAGGRRCVSEGAEVEHSILLEGSTVRGLDGRMESSLLGRDVHISRSRRQPKAYRFMVGDNSETGIL